MTGIVLLATGFILESFDRRSRIMKVLPIIR
jgi:hypothetical protein